MSDVSNENENPGGPWAIPAGSEPQGSPPPEGPPPPLWTAPPLPPATPPPPPGAGAFPPFPGAGPTPPFPGAGTTPPFPPAPPSGPIGPVGPAGGPSHRPFAGRSVRLAAAAVLTAVAMGVGIVAGHVVWNTGASLSGAQNSATPPSSSNTDPNTYNPFGGSGNPFGGGSGSGNGGSGSSGAGSNGGTGSSTTPGSGAPADTAAIAAKVDPDLVDIDVQFGYQSASGAGTGIVLTSNGEILTNNHVIDGATTIRVTDVGNGKTYGATVVGYDPIHDMALLQLQGASGLQTATIGDSSTLKVGDGVVAIGNAGGTGGTPTSAGGSVTNLDQAITASDELDGTSENLSGLIEVNADIQEGDSGGALVNSQGQVVGMNTAAEEGFSLSINGDAGYAIPIDQAIATIHQIEAGNGSSDVHVGPTAFLGLLLGGSNEEPFGQTTSGVPVSGTVAGGPTAKAGLGEGDTVTSLNGQSVSSDSALRDLLIPDHPGDTIKLGWTDSSGQSHVSTITLASGPAT